MASVFTKIINGDIPCYKIAEDENHFAFFDINPAEVGHTLVVPKEEIDYIFELTDEQLAGLHIFAKKVALAMESEIDCKRIGVGVLGLEVPHAHVHLVPLIDKGIIDFKNKAEVSKDEMADLASKINKTFQSLYQ